MRTAERRTKKAVGHEPTANGRVAVRIAGRVDFPAWITDHESFRRWARSPECPEKLRVAYYDDAIWVDPDMEQFFVHNQVKAEISTVVRGLVQATGIGRFVIEGMLLSNREAQFSTIPDGYFVSYEAFLSGRVRQVPGKQGGCVELEGAPEMIVEVVSDSSVQKDLVEMPPRYFTAGVLEYWTVDVRGEVPVFHIWRRGPSAFVHRRPVGGWRKSELFGRSFRLVRGEDPLGEPVFTLEVK